MEACLYLFVLSLINTTKLTHKGDNILFICYIFTDDTFSYPLLGFVCFGYFGQIPLFNLFATRCDNRMPRNRS